MTTPEDLKRLAAVLEETSVYAASGSYPTEDMIKAREALHTAIDTVCSERDAAQAEALEQARIVGMGGERELRLIAERDAARQEAERLRRSLRSMLNLWQSTCNTAGWGWDEYIEARNAVAALAGTQGGAR